MFFEIENYLLYGTVVETDIKVCLIKIRGLSVFLVVSYIELQSFGNACVLDCIRAYKNLMSCHVL